MITTETYSEYYKDWHDLNIWKNIDDVIKYCIKMDKVGIEYKIKFY